MIRADEVVRDAHGEIVELRCSHDPATLGRNPSDGRKVKGVIHWVEASQALDCEVRLYDRLFLDPQPDAGERNFIDNLNPHSLAVLRGCRAEPGLAALPTGASCQFEREGYFCRDPETGEGGAVVFNRTIGLRDTWSGSAAAKG